MELAWLVPALPFAAFAIIGLGTRRRAELSSFVTLLAIAASCLISWWLFFRVVAGERYDQQFAWLALDLSTALPFGILVDPLSALMLIVVTTVSLLIQIYSRKYLYEPDVEDHAEPDSHHGTPPPIVRDPGYARYFAYMALFTASMLGLVLSNNLLTIYLFWEGVGLGSYLLIGFWFKKPEAAAAAKKAFVTTRFGDFGFLIGILFIYWNTGTLDFTRLASLSEHGEITATVLTIGALLMFAGAVGKSAQFPLHVWLPDAMEGPTPVSALIHAATMVAAGVYLVARAFPIFEHSPTAMLVVAFVGGFTAIFAASMGLVANDIKRVLAFSTVSQLGYMMLGLGAGSIDAGMFHLYTHAFFKALLFLAAGSVIFMLHRAGAHDPANKNPLDPPRAQDIRFMGGMWSRAPITAWTMTIGALSLAGVFPFAGFWSKDEILLTTYDRATQGGGGLYWLLLGFAMITVFMTAFYMFRVIFLTFAGQYRGPADPEFIKESPRAMTVPLMILAVPSIVAGFWGAPQLGNPFGQFLEGPGFHAAEMNYGLVVLSSPLALAGIGLAWAMYKVGMVSPRQLTARLHPVYVTLYHKYWIDEVYMWLIDKLIIAVSYGCRAFDENAVDGAVNGVAAIVGRIGDWTRHLQTGRIPAYELAVFGGLAIIALFALTRLM